MTEDNIDRLQEIKDNYFTGFSSFKIKTRDFEWLIQEVERLVKRCQHWQSSYMEKRFGLEDKIESLIEERNVLRSIESRQRAVIEEIEFSRDNLKRTLLTLDSENIELNGYLLREKEKLEIKNDELQSRLDEFRLDHNLPPSIPNPDLKIRGLKKQLSDIQKK